MAVYSHPPYWARRVKQDNNGKSSGNVWSSSQYNATNAYYLNNGNVNYNSKNGTYAVLVGYELYGYGRKSYDYGIIRGLPGVP